LARSLTAEAMAVERCEVLEKNAEAYKALVAKAKQATKKAFETKREVESGTLTRSPSKGKKKAAAPKVSAEVRHEASKAARAVLDAVAAEEERAVNAAESATKEAALARDEAVEKHRAAAQAIRTQYRQRSRKWHPDRAGPSTSDRYEAFRAAAEALSSPTFRVEYVQTISATTSMRGLQEVHDRHMEAFSARREKYLAADQVVDDLLKDNRGDDDDKNLSSTTKPPTEKKTTTPPPSKKKQRPENNDTNAKNQSQPPPVFDDDEGAARERLRSKLRERRTADLFFKPKPAPRGPLMIEAELFSRRPSAPTSRSRPASTTTTGPSSTEEKEKRRRRRTEGGYPVAVELKVGSGLKPALAEVEIRTDDDEALFMGEVPAEAWRSSAPFVAEITVETRSAGIHDIKVRYWLRDAGVVQSTPWSATARVDVVDEEEVQMLKRIADAATRIRLADAALRKVLQKLEPTTTPPRDALCDELHARHKALDKLVDARDTLKEDLLSSDDDEEEDGNDDKDSPPGRGQVRREARRLIGSDVAKSRRTLERSSRLLDIVAAERKKRRVKANERAVRGSTLKALRRKIDDAIAAKKKETDCDDGALFAEALQQFAEDLAEIEEISAASENERKADPAKARATAKAAGNEAFQWLAKARKPADATDATWARLYAAAARLDCFSASNRAELARRADHFSQLAKAADAKAAARRRAASKPRGPCGDDDDTSSSRPRPMEVAVAPVVATPTTDEEDEAKLRRVRSDTPPGLEGVVASDRRVTPDDPTAREGSVGPRSSPEGVLDDDGDDPVGSSSIAQLLREDDAPVSRPFSPPSVVAAPSAALFERQTAAPGLSNAFTLPVAVPFHRGGFAPISPAWPPRGPNAAPPLHLRGGETETPPPSPPEEKNANAAQMPTPPPPPLREDDSKNKDVDSKAPASSSASSSVPSPQAPPPPGDLSVREMLGELNLSSLLPLLEAEDVLDVETYRCLRDSDLAAIGLKIGPRARIRAWLAAPWGRKGPRHRIVSPSTHSSSSHPLDEKSVNLIGGGRSARDDGGDPEWFNIVCVKCGRRKPHKPCRQAHPASRYGKRAFAARKAKEDFDDRRAAES